MKLTKMIYVASAYSHKDKLKQLFRYRNVTECIGKLQDKYPYAFIGPITQSHQTAAYMKRSSTSFKAWKLRDLTYMSRCDELWLYADEKGAWRESIGVKEELTFAVSNDLPIKFIHHKTFVVKPLKFKQA